MIAVIDCIGNNFASVKYALQRLQADYVLTHDINQITNASHVLLPGVGTAKVAMKNLTAAKLQTVIPQLTQPVLGICLGMQVLFTSSNEGNVDCLRIIPGQADKLSSQIVPHMGWNNLSIIATNSLLTDVEDEHFYFVHSYCVPVSVYTLATAKHDVDFSAVVKHNNFYGVQFHPERSGQPGERILKNFLGLNR